MTVYKSGISAGLYVPVAIILCVVTGIMIREQIWPGLVLMLLVAILITGMLLTTYYEIEGESLLIRCGFSKQKLDINTILKIKETNNPLSAPAASLDRLELRFGKFNTIMISPKDKEGFINHLLSINPLIEVKRQIKRKTKP